MSRACLVLTLLLGGCADTSRAATDAAADVTSCTTVYVVVISGSTSSIGGCAGTFPAVPARAELGVGGSLSFTTVTAADGTPLAALPRSTDSKLLTEVDGSKSGQAAYRAVAPGQTGLVVTSTSCVNPSGRCTVLTVSITG